jgi:hypothetical protein
MAKMLVSLTPLRKHALLTALDEARLALKPEDVASFDVWAAAGLGQRYARGMPAAFKIAHPTHVAVSRSIPGPLLKPASPTSSASEEPESLAMSCFETSTAFALAAVAKTPPDSREHLRFKLAQRKCADALGVSISSSQSPQSPPASQQAKQAFTDSSDVARHWQLLFEFSVAADEFCSSEETGAS